MLLVQDDSPQAFRYRQSTRPNPRFDRGGINLLGPLLCRTTQHSALHFFSQPAVEKWFRVVKAPPRIHPPCKWWWWQHQGTVTKALTLLCGMAPDHLVARDHFKRRSNERRNKLNGGETWRHFRALELAVMWCSRFPRRLHV